MISSASSADRSGLAPPIADAATWRANDCGKRPLAIQTAKGGRWTVNTAPDGSVNSTVRRFR